jgi:hypothetical protein
MTDTKTRAAGKAGQGQQPEVQPQPEPTPEPEAKPEPYALVEGVEVHIPVYRGVVKVTMPDGETVETLECECKWAHTTPEIAAKCGRKIATARGLTIGAPAS